MSAMSEEAVLKLINGMLVSSEVWCDTEYKEGYRDSLETLQSYIGAGAQL
jgi:hypothetical protein